MKNGAYIWGAAKYGERAIKYCAEKFNIIGFIDRRADENFTSFIGYPVISPETFFDKGRDEDIILAVTYPAEIVEELRKRNIKNRISIFDGRNPDRPFVYEIENFEICIPEYMNKRFAELDEYSLHYSELSEYQIELYKNILDMIKKFPCNVDICEIGCGSGQIANMLFDHGYRNYTGIDFSSEAIRKAQNINQAFKDKFICTDAFSYMGTKTFNVPTLFLCFEVLEHIGKDCELLEMLPSGANIIFSVPSFKSFNHLRTFNTISDIENRYSMLEIREYRQLPASKYKEKYYNLALAARKQ